MALRVPLFILCTQLWLFDLSHTWYIIYFSVVTEKLPLKGKTIEFHPDSSNSLNTIHLHQCCCIASCYITAVNIKDQWDCAILWVVLLEYIYMGQNEGFL
jgi:hypothetical protein